MKRPDAAHPVCNKSDIAAAAIKANPAMASKTLARQLLAQYPQLFTSVEQAREHVRYARGAHGPLHRASRGTKAIPRPKADAERCRQWGALIPDPDPNQWAWQTLPERVKRWLIVADLHVPYHDKAAVEATLRHADGKCDGILILGDLLDAYQLSYWCRDPRQRRFREELEATKAMLDVFKELRPKAMVLKGGNHELRLERYLQQHAPELSDMPGMDYRTWLGLDARKIQWIDYMDPIAHHKLALLHGHEWKQGISSPVNPARGAFLKSHACVLVAHLHRASEHPESDIFGTVDRCWSIGCLCNLHPRYNPLANKWTHGFAYLTTGPEWSVENHTIIDGAVY